MGKDEAIITVEGRLCHTGIHTWPEIPDNATAHARGYLAIWPPNTQRKCMAEIKQNKIEQVLAYREQVPRCGRVLKRFLGYSD